MAAGITRFSNVHLSNSSSDTSNNLSEHRFSKKIYFRKNCLPENYNRTFRQRCLEVGNPFYQARKRLYFIPLATSEDNMQVNDTTIENKNSDMEEIQIKLTESIQEENFSSCLVQSIHDAARAIELAVLEHRLFNKGSLFYKAWLGVDQNAPVKTLSYQAAVHALLQAAIKISSCQGRTDSDTNIFVQRSLLLQCSPLEMIIREELSAKQPAVYEWYWSYQHTLVVTTFVNLFENDPCFSAATSIYWNMDSSCLETTRDISLLMFALSCLASIKKLGSAKLSCPQFFSSVPDTVCRLMDKLLNIVSLQETYYSMKEIGLGREFICNFGPRAAAIKDKNDLGIEEMKFWIDLIQNQLQRALNREKIWSRLSTCENIEVLEKDLAIFGLFIALGRSCQIFLAANKISALDAQIEGIIRYLISGSVLHYPQLSSISSYQLFVEVVCEELEWLPFYKINLADENQISENKSGSEEICEAEAISTVLDVCSYWMTNFIKYSTWLENPSNIKAATYLSRGHTKLVESMKEIGRTTKERQNKMEHEVKTLVDIELDSFDKSLESVEDVLVRLEGLLQELHLPNSNPKHPKATGSDLERIRKLKKEAEYLEVSVRTKVVSLEQRGAEGLTASSSESESFQNTIESRSRCFWGFLLQNSNRKAELRISTLHQDIKSMASNNKHSESSEVHRFENLRAELLELEKRVQKTTEESKDNTRRCNSITGKHIILHSSKKDGFISKSIEELKKSSINVWQGTQLLAIDAADATVLLRRSFKGDKLTPKENKALKRTLTDLASVIPIGFLMLLPVTAVGHAAILAAIQRYAPTLIPSTYGPERLDLLRQLEKVKEMETTESNSSEMTEAINPQ